MKKEFSIEYQYQEYLKKIKLPESKMAPTQRIETRRTFFGACGVMLLLLRDELSKIEDENECIEVLENIKNQISTFFLNEANRQN